MSCGRLKLCEEIGIIVFSLCPYHIENALANSVSGPVVTHVNGLGSTELNGISRDADCILVVCIDLGSGLRVVDAGEDYAFEVSMLCVDE